MSFSFGKQRVFVTRAPTNWKTCLEASLRRVAGPISFRVRIADVFEISVTTFRVRLEGKCIRAVIGFRMSCSGAHREVSKAASEERAGNSFEVIAYGWFARQLAIWAPSHADRTMFVLAENNVFPWLGRCPITEITAKEVLAAMNRITDRGVGGAWRSSTVAPSLPAVTAIR
ncbi:MAG: hypothetical protein LBL59_05955 [Xanthomonadaceae bacterium]|jgi:hypothetical protein|nr:hypothetical protein [Xanthomonadaceae bacterium]